MASYRQFWPLGIRDRLQCANSKAKKVGGKKMVFYTTDVITCGLRYKARLEPQHFVFFPESNWSNVRHLPLFLYCNGQPPSLLLGIVSRAGKWRHQIYCERSSYAQRRAQTVRFIHVEESFERIVVYIRRRKSIREGAKNEAGEELRANKESNNGGKT